MKNRKIVVASFLLIAVLLMGIGYAAVSDTFNFDGSAKISGDETQSQFDLDVRITAVAKEDKIWVPYQAGGVVEIEDPDLIVNIIDDTGDDVQDSAKFQIMGLADAGDYQDIWFKIENESSHATTLKRFDVTETGTGDFFESNYVIYDSTGTNVVTEIPAKAGDVNGAVWVKLTVTLKSTPAEAYEAGFVFAIGANVQ